MDLVIKRERAKMEHSNLLESKNRLTIISIFGGPQNVLYDQNKREISEAQLKQYACKNSHELEQWACVLFCFFPKKKNKITEAKAAELQFFLNIRLPYSYLK